MIKKTIVACLLVISCIVNAQESTGSPYSYYGIGDVRFKGTNEFRSMAGINMLQDSLVINVENPASYSSLQFTTFSIGGNTNFGTLKTTSSSEKTQRTAFDYLAVAFPAKKLGFAIGILPYSSVGYRTHILDSSTDAVSHQYKGSGGVNRAFVGASYAINPNWSVGVNAMYHFGEINNETYAYFTNVAYLTYEKNTSQLDGFGVNFALQHSHTFNKQIKWVNSLTFQPEINIHSYNTRDISITDGTFTIKTNTDITSSTNLNIPMQWTAGTGIGKANKWFVGLQYQFNQTSHLKNRFTDIYSAQFTDSYRFSAGGYYVPQYNSYNNLFKRMVYRAGFQYGTSGIEINNTAIRNYGMDFGIGVPVGGMFSKINLGIEIGKKGTTSNNLIQENYYNVHLGLSFNDKWFKKRKFD